MNPVFLSYSKEDHFFAELVAIKLEEAKIKVWRYQGQLVAGNDWRQDIEKAITSSSAVLIALSERSALSPYVTYEWAYALGNGKTIIPLKLSDSMLHPKLEPIQHFDFSIPGALPWQALIARLQGIEDATRSPENTVAQAADAPGDGGASNEWYVDAILTYLNQRGYQMVSYDRIRTRIDPQLTDAMLDALVDSNKNVFRHAVLKDNKPGLAKRVP